MLSEEFHIRIDESDPQTVLFEYPKAFKSSYVTQAVRLEIGTLAAWTPSEAVQIVPDIQKIYPMLFDGDFIEVRTVLPERTFWEKATSFIMKQIDQKELAIPKRYARHYYDLVCIANRHIKTELLRAMSFLKKLFILSRSSIRGNGQNTNKPQPKQ